MTWKPQEIQEFFKHVVASFATGTTQISRTDLRVFMANFGFGISKQSTRNWIEYFAHEGYIEPEQGHTIHTADWFYLNHDKIKGEGNNVIETPSEPPRQG